MGRVKGIKKWLVSLLETSISRKVLPTLGPRDQWEEVVLPGSGKNLSPAGGARAVVVEECSYSQRLKQGRKKKKIP